MNEFCCDSYCGLYCGACEVLVAYKRGLDSGKLPLWEDLPERFRSNLPTGKTDEIKCLGCKTDTVFAGCAKCLIRHCAKNKMKVEFCFECKKFPCLTYKLQRAVVVLFRLEKKLPHLKSVKPNQEMIKHEGADKWRKDQKEKW